jgi:hypothetical protein
MPSYDWWALTNGAWRYLGRYKVDDCFGMWAALSLVAEAQLYCRRAPF